MLHALEMEEAEGLVSSSSGRKKIGSSISSNSRAGRKSFWASLALRTDFMPKLVVAGCLALMVILYLASRGGQEGVLGDVETKEPAVVAVPVPVAAVPTAPPVQVPVEDEDVPPPPLEGEPAAPPPSPPPAEEEVPPKEGPAESPQPPGSEEAATDEGSDPNRYSEYATILPLIDHPLPDAETKEVLAEKFGKWRFWDGDEAARPSNDFMSKYPNRDVPGQDFPDNAWQGDAVFVNHYLNDADKLISRTMEAIFTEYGHGKPLEPEGIAERMKMFHWSREDLATATGPPEKYAKRGDRGNGGWTTKRSFYGLVRRILHAMMTQDTFTVVMGGHSAAAGQGNHFRQSYMMQFHKIMYPVFARVGVKLITRNMAQGGLGTIQAGMGSGAIYGNDVDLLLWDSGMTEGGNLEHIDVFLRQGLLGGNRVPVVWGAPFELLQMLHEHADVDVGDWGQATDGILEVESADQAKEVPWAARFLKCKPEAQDLCNEEPRFCATCWIDREDGIVPEANQLGTPKGQVKWHPGWRSHQLTGRNIAFALLSAMQSAVNIWIEGVMGGPPLADDFWHVTDYYENIRTKVKNLDKALGNCYGIDGSLPTRLCNTPMKAVTQYTPRANFFETALTSIIKPAPDGYIPMNGKEALYEGPDAHNPCMDVPEGSIDVFNVVTGRRQLNEDDFPLPRRHLDAKETDVSHSDPRRSSNRHLEEDIVPGKGWEVWEEPQGICDGTYNVTCDRYTKSECVLLGHHDFRGAVIGNEFSGWLVMTLKDLKEGIIVVKLHTWHTEEESTMTVGWTSVDNTRQRRRLGESWIQLGEDFDPAVTMDDVEASVERMTMRSYDTPELPDNFALEYAIDGKVTTLTKSEFLEQKKLIQRVVETITLLDDPNFTQEARDVEIAIRLRGSGRSVVFGVSHVYWA